MTGKILRRLFPRTYAALEAYRVHVDECVAADVAVAHAQRVALQQLDDASTVEPTCTIEVHGPGARAHTLTRPLVERYAARARHAYAGDEELN